jgi:hypothetical protein
MRDAPDRGSHSHSRRAEGRADIYTMGASAMSVLRHFGASCIFTQFIHTSLAALPPSPPLSPSLGCDRLEHLGRGRPTRDAISSMKYSRGSSSDLSAPSTPELAKDIWFLQQDRRRRRQRQRPRPGAALRISITITNHCTPHSLAIAASLPRPPPPRLSSRHLNPRHSSPLAVEAPLKRRRKQDLLLPTSKRRPP